MMSRQSLSTNQKLDALIKSVMELKKSQDSSHKELEGKLQKLKEDIAALQERQEDATERAVKRLRREKPYEFCCKGHEEQYHFNLGIADHVAAATTQLDKIQPASEKDKATQDKVRKELEEGACALAECQKHIRIADQSKHSWETVAAYIDNDVASNEDNARRIEKRGYPNGNRKPLPPPPPSGPRDLSQAQLHNRRDHLNQHHFCYQGRHYRHPSTARTVGLCWACGKVGHLKISCSRLSKLYLFMSIDKSGSGGPSKV